MQTSLIPKQLSQGNDISKEKKVEILLIQADEEIKENDLFFRSFKTGVQWTLLETYIKRLKSKKLGLL